MRSELPMFDPILFSLFIFSFISQRKYRKLAWSCVDGNITVTEKSKDKKKLVKKIGSSSKSCLFSFFDFYLAFQNDRIIWAWLWSLWFFFSLIPLFNHLSIYILIY